MRTFAIQISLTSLAFLAACGRKPTAIQPAQSPATNVQTSLQQIPPANIPAASGGGTELSTALPRSGINVFVDQEYAPGEGLLGATGVELQRMRAWRRNPDSEFASHSAGDAPDFDLVTVDLWFKLEGENQQRYRRISGLRLDKQGWAFPSESLGGFDADVDETMPLTTFQRTAAHSFVLSEKPLRFTMKRATNIILESAQPNRAVQQGVISAYEMGFDTHNELAALKSFSQIKRETFASNANLLGDTHASRTIWKKNERSEKGFALKAPIACVIETRNGGNSGYGGFNPPQLISHEVELAELLHNSAGHLAAQHGTNPGANCIGSSCKKFSAFDPTADDELWVKFNEAYYITGINLNPGTRQLRITKKVAAPIYLNRQLPAAQSSAETSLSGIEVLIRQCNDEARKNAQSVGSNELLTAKGQFNIMGTIGFTLIANAKSVDGKVDATRTAQAGPFQTPLLRFCDAMPDSQSSSASLNSNYSSLKSANPVIEAAPTCASEYASAAIPKDVQGQALGTVLDKLIAPGTWNAELNAHTGPSIKPSMLAAERPIHLLQIDGESVKK